MPYNNTPITPSKEVTGTVSLPLARVKKIIAADDDISNCSNNAAFVITVAAEMFLQHLVEQAHNVVKAEKKPRRNIQYRDVANAVARVENLEFLTDVVPKTTTYKQVKQKARAQPTASAAGDEGGPPVDAAEQVDRSAAQNGITAMGGQARIEDAMAGRMLVHEVPLYNPGQAPSAQRPTSQGGIFAERQATNGASQHTTADAMDVDSIIDTKPVVTQNPMPPPERDMRMESA